MSMAIPPAVNYRDLVLIGGGHAHAQVIKMWGMQPLAGVRLTVISPQVQTPYSGMLPGLVAGHYQFDDAHIDLMRLCQFAGARFIQASVVAIDLEQKQLLLNDKDRPPIGFDLLSINSGITPDLSIAGAEQFATPVKPISDFYPRWQHTLETLRKASTPAAISVVGGGAAGVELILAMQHAISQYPEIITPNYHLLYSSTELLKAYPQRIRKLVNTVLQNKGIQLHAEAKVINIANQRIDIEGAGHGQDKNHSLPSEHIFWCTNAKAADWPRHSGLACDANGFIAINDSLQSLSHDFVFAAGDTAQQVNHPRPAAGVFAVRQGPVLFANLQRKLLGQPLKQHRPQKDFLSILALGGKTAIAHRPLWPTLSGDWVWRWKDNIDRRFMAMFSELSMSTNQPRTQLVDPLISGDETPSDAQAMRCGGCGAKVGASTLSKVIKQLSPVQRDDIAWGLDAPDDAAAIWVNQDQSKTPQLLLQSVDHFRAFIDEPYLLGQIAAQHALSDLFAMNAQPQSAMAIASLPFAGDKITERDLLQLMSGAVKVLNDNQCSLTGGHTSEAAELSIGFVVNGLAAQDAVLTKADLHENEVLILSQALGTGTLFAAHGQLQAQGKWLEGALAAMLSSNRSAGKIFHDHGATACTDVTGFGLLGHLVEMLKPSGLSAQLKLGSIPALDGALACLANGISSSLQAQNQRIGAAVKNAEAWRNHPVYPLLFDPQTSGGLLASVPQARAAACVQALREAGYPAACIIGGVYRDEETTSAIELTA
ncbi:selenide, water dikinase SelD [Zhongshania aliphaticivorans]|uniref:selenide, water dikinase SelD n=1 Tax=Zhongshania aliphaticivorans TaxID=1470434 RepID=UPI0039C9F053